MMLMVDGLYNDLEGVKYHHLGEENNYKYERIASILKGYLNTRNILSLWAKVMVVKTLD